MRFEGPRGRGKINSPLQGSVGYTVHQVNGTTVQNKLQHDNRTGLGVPSVAYGQ